MKLISIVGPVEDFDTVAQKYLLGFDMHVENAISLLDNVKGLVPFADDGSVAEPLAKIREYFQLAALDLETLSQQAAERHRSLAEITAQLDEVGGRLFDTHEKLRQNEAAAEANRQVIRQLSHMRSLDADLDEIFRLSFIKFRFGRLPKSGYQKLKMYLEDIDAIFVEGEIDADYVYGIYFMPAEQEEKIDAVFSALYFERIMISGDAHGTPEEACKQFEAHCEALSAEHEALTGDVRSIVQEYEASLLADYKSLKNMETVKALKKMSAHTRDSFYVAGWVPEDDTEAITKALQNEPNVIVVEEEPDIIKKATPPIRLRNAKLFRPFRMFVEMYGLPSYTELDPTPILAISYALLFGIMFGDVGHGLLLFLGGMLLYKLKKMDLAGIMAQAGFCATIFGFLYGSIFGNEEILRQNPITSRFFLISPMEDITTILISTVALGAVIIMIAMLLGMINAAKNKQWGKLLFTQNGLAGLVFYGFLLFTVVNMFLHITTVPAAVSALCIVLPLICMFLQEPLSDLLAGKKNWMPENMGEFMMESFFELFEVILSYATNTISFVRLGAFALAHGCMMSVVFILAGMTSGVGYVIVLILGNALVVGLEGLIVGIQSLRLEFYEMFSRFYEGGGRPFKNLKA